MFDGPDVLKLTARIVTAHLSRNQVLPDALPALIQGVYKALADTAAPPKAQPQEPAVPVRRSVFPDYLVCLEDGKRRATLKRHLLIEHGMIPKQYRAKWGLSASYPMTAPDFTSRRSAMAKEIGLGRKAMGPAAEPEARAEPQVRKLPARRARGANG